jgi:hypothetical protein
MLKKHRIQKLPLNVSNSLVINKKLFEKLVLFCYLITVCLTVTSQAQFTQHIVKQLVNVQF